MNDVRLWVVLLAVVSVLTGFAGGLLLSESLNPHPQPREPFADYHRSCVETFDLSEERAALLAELLRNYHRDLEVLRLQALAESQSEMEPDLVRIGLRYRALIRDHVLPEAQRAQFDELAGRAEELNPDSLTHG